MRDRDGSFARSCLVLAAALRSQHDRRARSPHARRPDDLADALAFALRFDGRKRRHDAAEVVAAIVAKRLVEHRERSGFDYMTRPPIGGAAALGRGFEGR